jgi:hypothetical protein
MENTTSVLSGYSLTSRSNSPRASGYPSCPRRACAHTQAGLARFRVLLQVLREALCRRRIGLLLQQLRLVQRGELPVGLEARSLADFLQREIFLPRDRGGGGDREARLCERGVRLREALDCAKGRALVGVAAEQPVELHEAVAAVLPRRREDALQVGLRLVDAVRVDEQARRRAERPGRVGRRVGPHLGRLDCRLGHARLERDLRRALGHARVLRLAREIGVSLRRQRGVAPLAGDLRQQELVHRLAGQLLLRQIGFAALRRTLILGCRLLRGRVGVRRLRGPGLRGLAGAGSEEARDGGEREDAHDSGNRA